MKMEPPTGKDIARRIRRHWSPERAKSTVVRRLPCETSVAVKCRGCGRTFRAYASEQRKGGGHGQFHSRACYYKFRKASAVELRVVIGGERFTLAELAAASGISTGVLARRCREGLTGVDLLKPVSSAVIRSWVTRRSIGAKTRKP